MKKVRITAWTILIVSGAFLFAWIFLIGVWFWVTGGRPCPGGVMMLAAYLSAWWTAELTKMCLRWRKERDIGRKNAEARRIGKTALQREYRARGGK